MQTMISLNVLKFLTNSVQQHLQAHAASICIDPSYSNKETSYDKHSPTGMTFEQPG